MRRAIYDFFQNLIVTATCIAWFSRLLLGVPFAPVSRYIIWVLSGVSVLTTLLKFRQSSTPPRSFVGIHTPDDSFVAVPVNLKSFLDQSNPMYHSEDDIRDFLAWDPPVSATNPEGPCEPAEEFPYERLP